jgi:hypothetical protein
MRSRLSFVTTLFLGSLTLACDSGRGTARVMTDLRAPAAERSVAVLSGGADPAPKTTSLEAMVASRKLIRTGDISLEVASYEKAAQEAARLAESLGGYVADSHSSRSSDGRQNGSLSLRVPAERFTQAVSGVKGMGTVRSQNVSAQDVTKAYTDLETRLRVKRDTADRLREILKTRTAGLSDILQAERELARITEEIEQFEGERRFYDQQVALSTLKLELSEPEAETTASWFDPIRGSFRRSVRILATSATGLVYVAAFLAPWLLVAWVLWLVITWIVRKRRKA